jgi:hypothetical protein
MADDRRGRESKVSHLIDKYELQGIGSELERRWTAEEDRLSLRELERYFNRQLLETVLNEENVQTLEGEIENTYRLLTDRNVGKADRPRIRRRLEREGVDVDDLLNDFVTYQAIRTYLTKHRGAEYTQDDTDPIEREIGNIQQLQGRVDAVTEGKVKQLRDNEHITLGDFRTIVDVQIVCTDCNSQFKAVELFEREGCNCTD